MLTVQPAQLNFNDDGIPCSVEYNDPYFSLADAVDESRYVFIRGNHLQNRWPLNKSDAHSGTKSFTISELGFGFGLNFITTCEIWIKAKPQIHLHYISFEKHPVRKDDLARFHTDLKSAKATSQQLIKYYPPAVAGTHRIHFDKDNITLTLIFGDALSCLKKSEFLADAWYLDGFSPEKNPELWSTAITKQVYRLTQQHGTFATYSAASQVRKNLNLAGFEISKSEGFGSKREMLRGVKQNSSVPNTLPYKLKNWLNTKSHHYSCKTAIIIGAGMAGCLTSAALAKRGWDVTLLDKNTSLASEGSGNPNAILMPRLSVDHDIQSQLTLQGYLYSLRYFEQLAEHTSFDWQQCGAIQLPRDEAQWSRMQSITHKYTIPHELLSSISQSQASKLSECEVSRGGWHIPMAASLSPLNLCESVLSKHQSKINFIGSTYIDSLNHDNQQWTASDRSGNSYSADVIILANAMSINQFPQTQWCTLNPKRGQITLISENDCNIKPTKIICADAYITPTVGTELVTGASFITNDSYTDIRPHEHEENIKKISSMIPSFTLKADSTLSGRAAIRAVTNDRLPIVGPAPIEGQFYSDFKDAAMGSTNRNYPTAANHQGLYMASGFGSRGLAWIPICAESLACMISNEPSPIDTGLMQAIHPNRFLMKRLTQKLQTKK